MANYNRPAGAYNSGSTTINYKKYQDDSSAVPRVPISSAKVDGDINYVIDAVNQLDSDIQNIVVGGIPDGSITEAKLATDSVSTIKMVDGNVTTDKLQDGGVTNIKMAPDSINTTNIVDEAITSNKIGSSQITESKIANGSVTEDKLAPGLTFGLPKGYISDTVSYVSSNQISWVGECRSEDDSTDLVVTTEITGVLSGSPLDTTRYMYIGYNSDTTPAIVVEFCTNLDGSDLSVITGAKRRVLSLVTDGLGDIIPFTSYTTHSGSLKVRYTTEIVNATMTAGEGGSSYRTINLTKPSNCIEATVWINGWTSSDTSVEFKFKDSLSNTERNFAGLGFVGQVYSSEMDIPTNASNELFILNRLISGGTTNGKVVTLGYIDERKL